MSTYATPSLAAAEAAAQPGAGLRILLLDNYDSFTYNLYQYLCQLGAEVEVVRNDEVTVAEIVRRAPDGIVISPGPSRPENAGVTIEVISELGPTTPILGVCLGHQAIGLVYGGEVIRSSPCTASRRRSTTAASAASRDWRRRSRRAATTRWRSRASRSPRTLEVTATSPDGLVMGVRHREHPVEGIQFHPESILTPDGMSLLANWLRSVASRRQEEARSGAPAAAGMRNTWTAVRPRSSSAGVRDTERPR